MVILRRFSVDRILVDVVIFYSNLSLPLGSDVAKSVQITLNRLTFAEVMSISTASSSGFVLTGQAGVTLTKKPYLRPMTKTGWSDLV